MNLAPQAREIVALVSRYHRRRGPRKRHEEFAALEPQDQDLVRKLSGLLRVADGLDRGHTAVVESVGIELQPDRVVIRGIPRLAGADLTLETYTAQQKSDVLEKVLGREVEIVGG